jgi:hypothetical protein
MVELRRAAKSYYPTAFDGFSIKINGVWTEILSQ